MARTRKGDAVSGVLLLDKPAGGSSNHALQQAKRLLNAAKAGHGGTLDPLATGLLPLLVGEATKFSSDLLDADKQYDATVRLGIRTRTADADGEVIETLPVSVTQAQLDAALSRFIGTISQVPPMVSALKYQGQPLYKLARQGFEVERAPRTVTIASIALLAFEGETFRMRVDCSKGTYVRTLAEDIGAVLGCGAHLAALTRTRVGPLRLDEAVSLASLEAMALAERRACLLPVDALLQGLPKVDLGEKQARRFAHGGPVDMGGEPGLKRVYGPDDALLGTAEIDDRGVLNPRRLIATADAVALEEAGAADMQRELI